MNNIKRDEMKKGNESFAQRQVKRAKRGAIILSTMLFAWFIYICILVF